jgi:signal transduction histidine kinase
VINRTTVVHLARRSLGDVGYLIAAFFVALPGFVATIVLFLLGIATVPIIVGLAVLTLCLAVAGNFAQVQRNLLDSRGFTITQTIYPPRTKGLRSRVRRLRHSQSWRELLHGFIQFVVSLVTFTVGVVWFLSGLVAIVSAVVAMAGPDEQGLAWLLGFPGRMAVVLLTLAAAAVLVGTTPFVLRGLVMLHVGIARGLLDDEASALRQQVSELASSRAAAGEAEAITLRKLERDLHDGPQQRLVRLGMDISAAERRIADDPEQAKAMLRSAFEQSQEALAEIRTLSRGIAPPILAEQGLRSAITALAARAGVPTTVDIEDVILSDAAQNAAYFVTAESLTNTAKHACATSGSVEVRQAGAIAVITIADDGVGGASAAKGHGIAGLMERLRGVDGTLTISSPPGGPTKVTATIPLADPEAAQ